MAIKRFVSFCFLFAGFTISTSSDFFLATDYNHEKYVCVTNSTFALSWIMEDIRETFHYVSNTIPIPNTITNNFDCDIKDDHRSKTYFIKEPWLLQTKHDLIFDERWEELPTLKTIHIDYSEPTPLNFYNAVNISTPNFEIPLSIRIEKEAHIFLCDGEKPNESNCYWFMLQAFSGKGSAIRKCKKETIPYESSKWPKDETCKQARYYQKHPDDCPEYLFKSEWSHFLLSKNQNVLTFSKVPNNQKPEIILQLEDSLNPIDVTNMIVHSKIVNGLWKIHNLDYIYTQKEADQVQLGPDFYTAEKTVCVSLYITMCPSCKITLHLARNKAIINEQTYISEHSGWFNIKFVSDNVPYYSKSGLKLLVSTKRTSQNMFWAIDKIRLCQKEEFRYIGLTEEARCQLMSSPNNVIGYSSTTVQSIQNNCPEDTIGEFCVKCTTIFDDCDYVTICNEKKCVCSAGYYGSRCSYKCGRNTYGHGCQKRCGRCFYSCNHVDGTCEDKRCTDSYSGPKCDIPPSVIFANPPEIISVSATEAVIRVSDFRIENNLNSRAQPELYNVQYKKADDSGVWNYAGSSYPFYSIQSFKIDRLESETQYLVRAIVTVDKRLQDGSHLKTSNFTTTCQEISDDNILIKSTNTSALVSLIPNSNMTCKSYTISIFDIKSSIVREEGTFFDTLTPYTEYTIIVKGNYKTHRKKFMTAEGVPSQVQNLILTVMSSSSIRLSWDKPEYIGGEFKNYIVKYQHVNFVECNSKSSTSSGESRLEVTDTSTIISALRPYSIYMFSVSAANTKFEGTSLTENGTTLASLDITEEEIPEIVEIVTGTDAAKIELSKIDCEKIRGPLKIKLTSTCTSDWCTDKTRTSKMEDHSLQSSITVEKLTPFSDYKLELKFCRSNEACNTVKVKYFKTDATMPRKVRNLIVYTKNETSISMRWDPPFPPTGILREYKIDYYYKNWYNTYKNKKITSSEIPCKLWPDSLCATITNLETSTLYTLDISARNEYPLSYGATESITTFTLIESSEPPYDLKIYWTDENRMKLEWKHPNKTNGDVKYFDICIKEKKGRSCKITKQRDVSVDTYNLTYYYEINATEFSPTTEYQVRVFAYNDRNGQPVLESTTSPPDLPELEPDVPLQSSNETITVTLAPKELEGKTESFRLILLISDEQSDFEYLQELRKYELKNMKLVLDCDITSRSESFDVIVGEKRNYPNCKNTENPRLKSATSYNITIILINKYKNETRDAVYWYTSKTTGILPPEDNSSLLALLALLLIIPLLAFLYMKRDKLQTIKKNFLERNNSSTEVLEIQDDQIPLSHVANTNVTVQTPKKRPEIQPKPMVVANPFNKGHSKPIKITDFEEYVKESIKNGELERQHALFPRGQTKPWHCGSLKENKAKNRYNNLLAYDHSRVILEKITGIQHSDYINANYIDGYKVRRAYIATQGPKASTLNDFWRMIWQENVLHIANVANIYEGGKKKLEKYWPDINETLQFGEITVQHLSTTVFADFEHRVFNVTHKEETRKVDQLHFSSWPDHGVPLYSQSLVPFLQRLLQLPISSKSPIVVHCSAGVGRTGTILLCDICLRMAAREGSIDVLRNLQLLREQRANMVDNIEQYKLAHLVVLECLVGLHTSFPCNELDETVRKMLENGSLSLQMRYLKDTQWQDDAMKTVADTGEEALVVMEKNRFEHIIPEIQGRVFITRYPPTDETSSYINAIKVDGFRCPGRFIVTQQPMPNTLGDFWRLIDESTTTSFAVIISLNEIDPQDKTCCSFWPTEEQPQMEPVPHITLKHSNITSAEVYDIITVHLYSNTRKEFLPVRIISMKNWAPGSNCPDSVEEFLVFWQQSESAARRSSPVFVTCYDGVKASGLYLAMSFIIEKMKLEQVCDVCQAVRNIRHNRQQFIQDLEQFEFLYKCAVLYINGFESYANFS